MSSTELRQQIKATAKENFKKQWGVSILLPLIVGAVVGILTGIPFLGWFGAPAIAILIGGPLMVNMERQHIKIFNGERAGFEPLFSEFKERWERKAGGIAWMALWMFLWSFVGMFTFGIVTIVKALSYMMTPYILADCPNVKAKDALKLSMRMTQGHKMDLFVAYLSFIGWLLLSIITCGILAIVYVSPYMNVTFAGYYTKLKAKAIESGAVSAEEFNPAGEAKPANAN